MGQFRRIQLMFAEGEGGHALSTLYNFDGQLDLETCCPLGRFLYTTYYISLSTI